MELQLTPTQLRLVYALVRKRIDAIGYADRPRRSTKADVAELVNIEKQMRDKLAGMKSPVNDEDAKEAMAARKRYICADAEMARINQEGE